MFGLGRRLGFPLRYWQKHGYQNGKCTAGGRGEYAVLVRRVVSAVVAEGLGGARAGAFVLLELAVEGGLADAEQTGCGQLVTRGFA